MRVRIIGLLACALLAACQDDKYEDIEQFVKQAETEANAQKRIESLPEVKPYEPFTYSAFDLPDPFKPRRVEPLKGSGKGLQPDLNRRKEELEAYPLDNLKMVGTLQKDKIIYALVRTPENSLYRVKIGNYMGQDFGRVSHITDSSIELKEIVQDSAGDWSERTTVLQLQDEQEKKK